MSKMSVKKTKNEIIKIEIKESRTTKITVVSKSTNNKKKRITNKKCSSCSMTQPMSCFNKHNSSKDGYVNKCKRCMYGKII